MEPPERLKSTGRRLAEALGLQVSRSGKPRWLTDKSIQTIFDVGANVGQFAGDIRRILPSAQIYAFEPEPAAFELLKGRFIHDDRLRAFNIALGDSHGTSTMSVNNFSPSSSLLPMAELHKEEFPFAAQGHVISIEVDTLDSIAAHLTVTPAVLVKVDVQGYEAQVIRGGPRLLRESAVLVVEVSFEPLYEGQASFEAIYEQLRELGFVFHGMWRQLYSRRNGQVLSADAIFVR